MTATLFSIRSQSGDIRSFLNQNNPLMPEEELQAFVKQFFREKSRYTACLDQHRTPLYLIDPDVLKKKSRLFQEAFGKELGNVSFYYAVKSNNHPDVARILLQTGVGLDVSSGMELEMAVSLNAPDVVFSGPGKTDEELKLAVEEADRLVVLIDSFSELSRLQKIAASQKKMVRIGVRLSTNPTGLWRKFGILVEELPQFLQKACDCRNLRFQGLQFHSSWNLTPDAQVDFLESLGRIIAQLPQQIQRQIQFVDIGGGFWPPQGEWLQEAGTQAGIRRMALGLHPGKNKKHYRLPALPIEEFARHISLAVKKHIFPHAPLCRICCEPGRWLCNDAMHILLSVVDKKGEDLVITDGGTNAVGWERFETDYFPVLNFSRPALTEKNCHILGSLCTPHDIWGYNYWGEDIQPGDILMIPTQGAYTYSLRQNFIKPLPEVFVLEEGARVGSSITKQLFSNQ